MPPIRQIAPSWGQLNHSRHQQRQALSPSGLALASLQCVSTFLTIRHVAAHSDTLSVGKCRHERKRGRVWPAAILWLSAARQRERQPGSKGGWNKKSGGAPWGRSESLLRPTTPNTSPRVGDVRPNSREHGNCTAFLSNPLLGSKPAPLSASMRETAVHYRFEIQVL